MRDGGEAVQENARAISEDASPRDRALIEHAARKRGILKRGERMNSEQAHRLSSEIARESDRKRG